MLRPLPIHINQKDLSIPQHYCSGMLCWGLWNQCTFSIFCSISWPTPRLTTRWCTELLLWSLSRTIPDFFYSCLAFFAEYPFRLRCMGLKWGSAFSLCTITEGGMPSMHILVTPGEYIAVFMEEWYQLLLCRVQLWFDFDNLFWFANREFLYIFYWFTTP